MRNRMAAFALLRCTHVKCEKNMPILQQKSALIKKFFRFRKNIFADPLDNDVAMYYNNIIKAHKTTFMKGR